MCRGETIYFGRQVFILVTMTVQSVSIGIMLAFSSVLNPDILDPEAKDIKATPAEASWLASMIGLTGPLGFLVLSPLMQVHGRKSVYIVKNTLLGIGWILLYYAKSVTTLYIGRAFQGVSMGGIYINLIIIGEFVHPTRRGYFSSLQKFALSAGTLLCHTMTIWFTWRQIAASALIWNVTSVVLTFFWPESPFYLAMRGRYDECEESFHWLNGTRDRSKELEKLISEQKDRREKKKYVKGNQVQKLIKNLKRPDFIKSFIIVALVTLAMDLSGRNFFKVYVIQIMKDLTGSMTNAVYISIGSDLLVLTALFLSCFAVKYFGRRVLLFSFGAFTIVTLFSIALILYLKSHNVIFVLPWLAPGLIIFTNFIVHVGVSPVCFVVMTEVFPLDLKGLGCIFNGTVFSLSYAAVLKLTPVLMDNIGLGGMYIVYGTCFMVCLVILYFILPETKDKTLLDIENGFKINKKPVDVNETLLKGVSS